MKPPGRGGSAWCLEFPGETSCPATRFSSPQPVRSGTGPSVWLAGWDLPPRARLLFHPSCPWTPDRAVTSSLPGGFGGPAAHSRAATRGGNVGAMDGHCPPTNTGMDRYCRGSNARTTGTTSNGYPCIELRDTCKQALAYLGKRMRSRACASSSGVTILDASVCLGC